MSELRELYQTTILDHNKSPRNFRVPEGANRRADGHNPLCGDKLTVHVALADGELRDVGFEGSGCAISTASASLMTQAVKGKSVAETLKLFNEFHGLLTAGGEPSESLGKLAVFAGVREYPMRVKCATLAWHTLRSAIEALATPGIGPDAALAWWMLERMGQKKVSLLAESFDDWALGGLTIAKEPTTVGAPKSPQDMAVPAVTYRPGAVAAKAGSPYPAVYVAAGKQAPASAPAGSERGAKVVHLPYTDLLDGNGLPKAAKDLWNVIDKAGLPRYAKIVAFSDQVGEAAANVFVLRLMGFSDVKVWMPAGS